LVTVIATRLPSGDTAGLLTVVRRYQSESTMARGAFGGVDAAGIVIDACAAREAGTTGPVEAARRAVQAARGRSRWREEGMGIAEL
jgi:hypothetical protein